MDIQQLYHLYLRSSSVSTDSRNIPLKSIFFALKGENFNGNQFAKEAIQSGALFSIVDEKEYADEANDIYYVEDTLNALQKLALYHRKKLEIPFIALTGSNGKTTTKELITNVLGKKYEVGSTVGNLNNHIGVPLTLLSIRPEHDIAVVEIGANHLKEIEFLCQIIEPDFGYITNFGKAHLEGFGGEEGVIQGKSELYDFLRKNEKQVFVNLDDPKQVSLTQDIRRISFGTASEADYNFEYESHEPGLCPEIIYEGKRVQSKIIGDYNVSNVAAAIAIGLYFEVDMEEIKSAIEKFEPENNRSQLLKQGDYTILLDAYNANPSSMELALTNFAKFNSTKTVILGDMFELGETSVLEHENIVELAKKINFDHLYLIGENFYKVNLEENDTVKKFKTREDAITYLSENPISDDFILIKGSRGMKLEEIVDHLKR